MNSSGGAATQIYSSKFDLKFHVLPENIRTRIQIRIDELGLNLRHFPHQRLQGVDAFKLRVGDYRVIYDFSIEQNELRLITLGNRKDIYKRAFN